jgi:NAD(P)-dependent dehydrogenase (short-subunit alcohol dehydrogenase family)
MKLATSGDMGLSIVTGANRGIGLELCRGLKNKGAEVVGVCRGSSKELDALGVRIADGVDVNDDASVAELARKIGAERVDLLINNAGILMRESLDDLDFERIRNQLETNAIAPLRVTRALLPNLGPGSKIAIITSRMGSIADNGSGGYYGYRMSKAAVNAAGKSLSIDLATKQIPVVILHPGFVKTDMTAGAGNIPPQDAARDLLKRIDELTLESTGRFLHANGEALPW